MAEFEPTKARKLAAAPAYVLALPPGADAWVIVDHYRADDPRWPGASPVDAMATSAAERQRYVDRVGADTAFLAVERAELAAYGLSPDTRLPL